MAKRLKETIQAYKDDLIKHNDCVDDNISTFTYAIIARRYYVNSTTLSRRLRQKFETKNKTHRKQQRLTCDDETLLIK